MAAGRIRGITIEIGGDTTKLESALKKVDSSIWKTQTSLKDVNKLLKLDPKNTELLTQKQRLLGTQIDDTKGRLKTLREAAENVTPDDIGQDKYDALQREIIETENSLKALQTQAAQSSSVLGSQLQAAGEKIKEAGAKVTEVGTTLTTKLTVPLVAAGTVAVSKFAEVDKTMQLTNKTMGNSAEQADMLNAAMKNAASNSTFGMKDAADATLNFARAGLDAEQAASALAPAMNLAAGEGGNLDTVSAGLVATINGFHGSFDEAGRYADVFAAACNNSALDVDSLSNAMSTAAPIFSAAGYSVNDAALYMGVMANAGIDAEKAANSLKTGLARLVDPPKDAAEAMEKLGISVTNSDGTMKDSTQIQKELHDAFGKLSESEQLAAASAIFGKNQMAPWLALINTAPEEVRDLDAELEGAGMSIDDFTKKLSENGLSLDSMKKALAELGVDEKAFDEALKTSGGSAGKFSENLLAAANDGTTMDDVLGALGGSLKTLQETMNATSGTTEEMYEAMMSGFGGSLEKLKSSIDVLVTSFGEALAPTIQQAADFTQGLVDKFNALSPAQQETIAKIALLVAALGPVITIVGGIISVIGTVVGAIGTVITAISAASAVMTAGGGAAAALGAAVAALGGPVTVVVGVIVGLIAVGALLIANWDKIKEAGANLVKNVSEKWNNFKKGTAEAFSNVAEKVKTSLTQAKDDAVKKATELKDKAVEKWNNLKEKTSEAYTNIKEKVSTTLSDAKDKAVQTATDLKDKAVEKWTDLKSKTQEKFENIKSDISDKITNAKDTAVKIATDLNDKVVEKWTDLVSNTKEKWENIKSDVSDKITNTKETAVSIAENLRSTVSDKWENLKTAAGYKFKDIKDHITGKMTDSESSATKSAGTLYTNVSNKFIDAAKAANTNFADLQKNITDKMSTALTNAKTSAGDIAKKIGDKFGEAAKTASTKFGDILRSVRDKMKDAANAVSDTVKKIRDKMNFHWSLPHLKLPHVHISGHFSLNPPSVPHFSIDWRKTAMENGVIFTNPTIFGMMNGRFQGAGDAGAEALVGVRSLQSMVRNAVASVGSNDPDVIYAAVKAGMENANIGIYIGEREFGRMLKGQGVVME